MESQHAIGLEKLTKASDPWPSRPKQLEVLEKLSAGEISGIEAAVLCTSHVEEAVREGIPAGDVLSFLWESFGALSPTVPEMHDQLVELVSEMERLRAIVVDGKTVVQWEGLPGFADMMGAFVEPGGRYHGQPSYTRHASFLAKLTAKAIPSCDFSRLGVRECTSFLKSSPAHRGDDGNIDQIDIARVELAAQWLSLAPLQLFRALRKEWPEIKTKLEAFSGVDALPDAVQAQIKTAIDAMNTQPKHYQYEPLTGDRTIRILYLFQHSPDQIGCTFIETPVDNPIEPYIALSYTWGTTTTGAPPTDGVITSDDDELSVTPNLYAFLNKAVRSSDHPLGERFFWIDQLCINQADDDEKSAQVAMMGAVYQSADEVVVWLGDGDGETAAGVGAIRRLVERTLQGERELGKDAFAAKMRRMGLEQARDSDGGPRPPFGEAAAVLARPWFQRVWVTQEIAFARSATVLCGDAAPLRWGVLATFADRVAAYRFEELVLKDTTITKVEAPALRGMKQVRKMNYIRENRLHRARADIADIVMASRGFLATDLRDKLFAFYSLVDSQMPKPDYRHSVERVYTDFMAVILVENARPELLSLAGVGSPSRMPGLPSWVVDWSQESSEKYLASKAWYEAAGGSKMAFKVSTDAASGAPRLHCRVVLLDMVLAKGPDHPEELVDRSAMVNYMAQCRELAAAAAARDQLEAGGQTLQEAFWRTMIADSVLDGSSRAPDEFAVKFQSWVQVCEIFATRVVPPEVPARFNGLNDIYELMDEAVEFTLIYNASGGWRRFFVTYSGTTGIGPLGLREDDVVSLIAGTKVAWILRDRAVMAGDGNGMPSGESPNDTSGDQGSRAAGDGHKIYQLVGECYIHGYMSGEGWDEADAVHVTIE
ncbi:hypothetical protein RB598_005596 [Gaeumannomyces tritici]